MPILFSAVAALVTGVAFYATPGAGAQGRAFVPYTLPKGEEPQPAPVAAPLGEIRPHAELLPADLNLGSAREVNEEDGGESLEYEIHWNGVPAGRTIMKVKKRENPGGKSAPEYWEVRMDTRSTRLVANFYPVKDKAISTIDVKGGFSRYYYANLREGTYKGEERIRMDYTAARMEALYERTRIDDSISGLTVPLSGKVLDPLSAIYYLRAIDLGANLKLREDLASAAAAGRLSRPELDRKLKEARIVLPICADRRVWDTEIVPVAREHLDVKGVGRRQACILIALKCGFNGLFQRRGDVRIWVHEAARIPVKMEVEIPIGACEVVLDRFDRAPFGK
ncbi:MAG: DUF3108 domain-containing protein [Planctomycetota bacterium]|nr:DUF3108 domain-containing protein [Planctomycetota bacterium]